MDNSFEVVRSAVAGFAARVFEMHAAAEPARIAFVYDEGSSTVFPLTVGVLPRKIEDAYRDKRKSDSDYQLLWNPEEFPIYATQDLLLQIDDAASEAIQSAIADDAGFFAQIRSAINRGCHDANLALAAKHCIVFATDPELVDVRANVAAIGNISAELAAEMPDWF
ncbi:MAG: hypothetical protein JNN30_16745 [Rhodanobacteraceae bacterium]|nr:hypothetical protein [Rhodanobacteraceae bacterium]